MAIDPVFPFWNVIGEWLEHPSLKLFSEVTTINISNEPANLKKIINMGFFMANNLPSLITLNIHHNNLGIKEIIELEPYFKQ